MQKKTYALCGAAGYVAPRHLKAIRDNSGELVAALDPNDSVGVIDSYFPQAAFFTEFERFDRHIDKLQRSGNKIDYLSVCSPNYLHDAHIRFGLRNHMDVICEKPLVLNPWNVDALAELEAQTGNRIFTILQLRLHPTILELRKRVLESPHDFFDIDLTYITPRGMWYHASWKGDISKSGGVATNIGVHFFDVLLWIFGSPKQSQVHLHNHDRAAGLLEFENARVRWFLSIDSDCLPNAAVSTFRSMKVNGEDVEFSDGFADLHTLSYREILAGNGFNLLETKPAIELIHAIRNSEVLGCSGNHHPFVELPLKPHPFL